MQERYRLAGSDWWRLRDAVAVGVAARPRHTGPVTDEVHEPAIASDPPHTDGPGRRRWFGDRIDRGVVVVGLALAIGIVLIGRGVLVGVTGDDRSDVPEQIERLDPVPEAVQVLSQTSVFADLESGFTGYFVIDGVEIETVDVDDLGRVDVEPGQQIDVPPVAIYEGGNATLTFTPSDEAPVEQFESGEHRVTLVFWRLDEGRQRARSYSWTFNVV